MTAALAAEDVPASSLLFDATNPRLRGEEGDLLNQRTAESDASAMTGGYARSAASSAPIPGRCQQRRAWPGPGDGSSPHYPRNDQ